MVMIFNVQSQLKVQQFIEQIWYKNESKIRKYKCLVRNEAKIICYNKSNFHKQYYKVQNLRSIYVIN